MFSKKINLIVGLLATVAIVPVLAALSIGKNAYDHNEDKLGYDADLSSEEEIPASDIVPESISSEKGEDEGCEDEGEFELEEEQVELIGRLAKGMRALIRKRDHGTWYYCGELLNARRQEEMSVAIAYNVVITQSDVGLDKVSPWGIVATAYNESGLDSCALGLYPRKWAYKRGMLKRRKNTCSHTKNEVLSFINDAKAKRRYSKSGFDLGMCQVLSRFYRGQEDNMLTMDEGIKMCIIEMQHRANRNKTNKPWLYWKGTSKTGWYRRKIRKWAKMMGATRKEMRGI